MTYPAVIGPSIALKCNAESAVLRRRAGAGASDVVEPAPAAAGKPGPAKAKRSTTPEAKPATDPAVTAVKAEPERPIPPHVWRIHGRDYDLASFVDKHPGGALMILLGKGTDCTGLFEQYHLLHTPRAMLRNYDISPDGLKPAVPEEPSKFLADIRDMVREYVAAYPLASKHKAPWFQIAGMGALLVLELAFAWRWFTAADYWCGAAAGFAAYLLMVNLAHDASHGALFKSPQLNTLGHHLGCAPWSTGQASWMLQHVVSHHQHTNEFGMDVDAHHLPFARWHREVEPEILPKGGGGVGAGVKGGGLPAGAAKYASRFDPRANLAGMHNMLWHAVAFSGSTFNMAIVHPIKFVFQPLYEHVMTGTIADARFMGAVRDAATPRHTLSIPPPQHEGAFEAVAGNYAAQHVLMRYPSVLAGNALCCLLSIAMLVSPLVAWTGTLGFGGALRLALVPYWISSLCFMLATQVSHIQEACQEAEVLGDPDPYKRQAMTSMDYCADSWLASFLTGALNLQSIHHTIPVVSLCHYRALYPKFLAVCAKHNCMPQKADGLFDVFTKHLAYVFKLGNGFQ